MYGTTAGDLLPDAKDLHEAACRSKGKAPGIDAWLPAEVALLPYVAWEKREEHLKVVAQVGKWPDAYKEVVSPCLRKMDKLNPDAAREVPTVLDHRLLSIYTQLYRIESSAWCRNHNVWLETNMHHKCFGGMRKRECLEASWEAQADLEMAVNNNDPLVVSLLDYHKFFDSFDPRFYSRLLVDMGIHRTFADLFLDINTGARRRIKIGNTYGRGLSTYNGIGQGDPKSLFVALAYITIQFRMLDDKHPSVNKGAVVDDRNLRCHPEQMQGALESTFAFDKAAGHLTNPKKWGLTGANKKAKEWCCKYEFDGAKPKVHERHVLVGDVLTANGVGNGALANQRAAHAIRGAIMASRAQADASARRYALKAIAIPRLLPSTVWTRPATNALRKLRTIMTDTLFGRYRRARCPEVVVAILGDPLRDDPRGGHDCKLAARGQEDTQEGRQQTGRILGLYC